MKRAWMVLALGVAPAVALACGDYDKSASAPDAAAAATPPAATKAAARTVAKADATKAQKATLVKVSAAEPRREATVARN